MSVHDEEKQNANREDLERRSESSPRPSSNHQRDSSADTKLDDKYYVEFDPDRDPLNPYNWPWARKAMISAIANYCCFIVNFASSVWSPATDVVGEAFNVSPEVATLVTSIYVLGYALGPILWGPASELYGRRIPLVLSFLMFSCFAAGAATGKDIQTVVICRFFCGVAGSCSLTVIGGVFTDMYLHSQRSIAMAVFSACIFFGPSLSPFIGGYTVMNHGLGWRFNGYWCLIMSALALVLTLVWLPETYAPTILAKKASKLRHQTGDWNYRTKQEELDIDGRQLLSKYFLRPLRMLVSEPLLFAVSFYMSFIYGILYLFFTAYPLVFEGVYHFNRGESGLPFIALVIGGVLGAYYSITQVPVHARKMAENNGQIVPEWRLRQVMIGGPTFAGGLFWFGWTGFTNSIHWIVPSLSGILTGFGFMSLFLPLLNYIIDVYLHYAASAISANTIMRSAFGAGFPMFATYMYKGLGIGLATTVLGSVAAALVPIPFLFHRYGSKLRSKSTFAPY